MKNQITGIITEFKSFATHDGPGIRTTVFIKGCPLRCKWCANPETWTRSPQIYFHAKKCKGDGECLKACHEGAISTGEVRIDRKKCTLCMECVEACCYEALQKVGREVTPEEVAKKIADDYAFFIKSGGGMTVSGGEPLSQPDFTSELMKICHERGIHTCLDTSGYAEPETLRKVLEYTDLVLLDIKHMDAIKHAEWTGVSNELILENAKLMAKECETRISLPLIPGINDSAENIKATAEFAISTGIKFVDVEPFHKLGEGKYFALGLESPYSNFGELTNEKLNEVITIFESFRLKTTRGRNV